MNTILIKAIFLFLIGINLISCEKQDSAFPYNTCLEGIVIGYEECVEGTLIQIKSHEFGADIVFHDNNFGDTTFTNVIKSPGKYPKGSIYFKAREYNKESDQDLFLESDPTPCHMVYGPYDVPIVVITDYSQTKCQ